VELRLRKWWPLQDRRKDAANASYNIVEESPIAAGLNIIEDHIIFVHKQAVQDRIYRRLALAGLFGASCDRDSRRETGLLK
jgi:hypothetical protein